MVWGCFFPPLFFFYNCWVHIARAAACGGDCLATCSGMRLRGCAFLTVVEGPCQRSAVGGLAQAAGALPRSHCPLEGRMDRWAPPWMQGASSRRRERRCCWGSARLLPPSTAGGVGAPDLSVAWARWGAPGVLSPLPLPVPPSPAFILWPRFPCDSSLTFFSWLSRKSAACSAPLKISVQQRHTAPVRRAP